MQLLSCVSTVCTCLLVNQTCAQYSAAEYTSARDDVRGVFVSVAQFELVTF